jgi:hypothetical protein
MHHTRMASLYGRCDCVHRAKVKTGTQRTPLVRPLYALVLSARVALDFWQWPDVDGTWTKSYEESEDKNLDTQIPWKVKVVWISDKDHGCLGPQTGPDGDLVTRAASPAINRFYGAAGRDAGRWDKTPGRTR